MIIGALVTSSGWPPAEQLVPRTACWAALIAAWLNLVTEIFGADEPAVGPAGRAEGVGAKPLAPAVVRRRALEYFAWLGGFVALVALVGFLPAVPVFVVCYMRMGFRQSWLQAGGCGALVALFCWAVFDRGLAVPWPHALLGDVAPALRSATGLM